MGSAGTALQGSDFDDVTETHYTKMLNDAAIAPSPLMKMMPLKGGVPGWSGDGTMRISFKTGEQQGVGVNLVRAQTWNSAPSLHSVLMTPVWMYGTAKLGREALTFVQGERSLINAIFDAMDSTRKTIWGDLSAAIYNSGTGAIGRVNTAYAGGNSVTLTRADDARKFFRFMGIKADNNESGASPKAGSTWVTARNLITGVITLNDATAITGVLAASDYLFRDSNENGMITGFFSSFDTTSTGGWIPNTAPTVGGGDSFFGLDRSVMVPELTGWSMDGSSGNVNEQLVEISARAMRLGAEIGDVFMNPLTYGTRIKEAGSKIIIQNGDDKITVGFTGMVLALPTGPAKVHVDPFCPVDHIVGLDMKHWWIQYAGKSVIDFQSPSGSEWHLAEDSHEFENRLQFCGQVCCDQPWSNFNLYIGTE